VGEFSERFYSNRQSSEIPEQAWVCLRGQNVSSKFVSDPRHEFCMDNVSFLDSDLLVSSENLLPSQVTDLYLVGLALNNHAKLATFDHSIPAHMIKNGSQGIEMLKA